MIECLPEDFDYNYAQIQSLKPSSYMIEILKNEKLDLEEKINLINLLVSKGANLAEFLYPKKVDDELISPKYPTTLALINELIEKEQSLPKKGKLETLKSSIIDKVNEVNLNYIGVSRTIYAALQKKYSSEYLTNILKNHLISEKILRIQNPYMQFLISFSEITNSEPKNEITNSEVKFLPLEAVLFYIPSDLHTVHENLIIEIFKGNTNAIKSLLTKNVIESFPKELGTPLHIAAYSKNLDIYHLIEGNQYIHPEQLDGDKRLASNILETSSEKNNFQIMYNYYNKPSIKGFVNPDKVGPHSGDYAVYLFIRDVCRIIPSKDFDLWFSNNYVNIEKVRIGDLGALFSNHKEQYLHDLAAKYITDFIKDPKIEYTIKLEKPYDYILNVTNDISLHLDDSDEKAKEEDTQDKYSGRKNFFDQFKENFYNNFTNFRRAIVIVIFVGVTIDFLKKCFLHRERTNSKRNMLDELTQDLVPDKWDTILDRKLNILGFNLPVHPDSSSKSFKQNHKVREIILVLKKAVTPDVDIKYENGKILISSNFRNKKLYTEVWYDKLFINNIEEKIPSLRKELIDAISRKEKPVSIILPTKIESSVVADIKPVSYVVSKEIIASSSSSSSSVEQPMPIAMNRGIREAKKVKKFEEIQKKLEENKRNKEQLLEQEKAAQVIAEQAKNTKKEAHRARKIAEKIAKEQAIKASVEFKERDNNLALTSSANEADDLPNKVLPKIIHNEIALGIINLEKIIGCDMTVNMESTLEEALQLKLDALQHLIISLIEDTKAFIHPDIRRVLKNVRGCLAKDIYAIEDRGIEVNLHELEGFSILLINFVKPLIHRDDAGPVDFDSDPFIRYVIKNVNHGLAKEMPDRDKMLIKSMEGILQKIKEYSQYNNFDELNYAIYHNIGLIGGIRKQFSEKFKEANDYFFDNIIDYGYTRARNKIFHGKHITDSELKNFIKQTENVLGILSLSINAKHYFEVPTVAPIYISSDEAISKGKGKMPYVDAYYQDQSFGQERRFIDNEKKGKGKGKEVSHVNSYYQSRSSNLEKHL